MDTSVETPTPTSAEPNTPAVRTVTEDEFPGWLDALRVGFLCAREITEETVRVRRDGVDLDRTLGAFEPDGRCVATFRTLPQRLTVPGGARVDSLAVTNVSVLPTHRRRGLLTRMMRRALAEGKERGDVCSTLDSAEYPIYGRYGYGPATWTTEWTVDTARTGLDPRRSCPEDGGRVDLVGAEEFRTLGAELHERVCVLPDRQGMTDRTERWWKLSTGEIRRPDDDSERPFHALHRDAEGRVRGLLTFTADENWEHNAPRVNARVLDLIADTAAAERALWHFALSLDWVATVHTGPRAPDSLLLTALPDPRAARVAAHSDFLWLRPLDVPALLRARTYPVPGSLVLELEDPTGLAGGRFLLDASPDGADCAPTTRSADLSMGVGALGSLYLGDESASRLRASGALIEERPGATALADVLLRTARRPWAPDEF